MNKLIKLFSKRAELINRQYLMGIKVAEKIKVSLQPATVVLKILVFKLK